MKRANTGWWVLIAVLAVTLVGLVIYALVGRGGPDLPDPDPTDPTTTPQSTCCGPEPSQTDPGSDWGELPPPNIDSLRAFDNPTAFPESVAEFVLDESSGNAAVWDATYVDDPNFRSFAATVSMGQQMYEFYVGKLVDPQIHGDAVCGMREPEGTFQFNECIIAGTNGALWVRGEVETVPFDEVVALTQELYDNL